MFKFVDEAEYRRYRSVCLRIMERVCMSLKKKGLLPSLHLLAVEQGIWSLGMKMAPLTLITISELSKHRMALC